MRSVAALGELAVTRLQSCASSVAGWCFVEVGGVETGDSGVVTLRPEDVVVGEKAVFHAALAWRSAEGKERVVCGSARGVTRPGASLEDMFVAEEGRPALSDPSGFCVNPRTLLLLELGREARRSDVSGIFEVHVTVQGDRVERFREMCEQLGKLKVIQIELKGSSEQQSARLQRQLMTASYHSAKSIADVQKIAFGFARAFVGEGFAVERVKIEAMCHSEGVPETSDYPPNCYFEFHVKLLLEPGQAAALLPLCARHNAHLSRNALKTVAQGEHRFVTQRMHKVGRSEAVARFEACVAELIDEGYAVVSRQREFSVYDTNVNLDAEWLEKSLVKSL